MANINYAFKEVSCKIVYYGPGLCGKTTNLQIIHKTIPPKFRGDLVSLATEQDRTLFFDFLPLDLGEVKGFKTKFQLYTVPGQVYYRATRRLVLKGADGVVFVADSGPDRMEENRESLEDLRNDLESYGLSLETMPYVIQYNKRDLPDAIPLDQMEALLNPDHVPSFEAVAVNGVGVKETLKAIAALVIRRITEAAETKTSPVSELERRAAAAAGRSGQVQAAGGSPGAVPPAVPPAAPEVPSSQILRPVAAPGPSRVERRAEGDVPDLHILQRCDLHWLGLRVGSAVVEIARQDSSQESAPYLLTCQLMVLKVFRSTWKCPLVWSNEVNRVVNHHTVPFYELREKESDAGRNHSAVVWVKKSFDKTCFVAYRAAAGEVHLTPSGRKWFG